VSPVGAGGAVGTCAPAVLSAGASGTAGGTVGIVVGIWNSSAMRVACATRAARPNTVCARAASPRACSASASVMPASTYRYGMPMEGRSIQAPFSTSASGPSKTSRQSVSERCTSSRPRPGIGMVSGPGDGW